MRGGRVCACLLYGRRTRCVGSVTRCEVRGRKAGGGTRFDARCGNGVRIPELDSMRSAEREGGFRSSIRCEVRRGKAGGGTRFGAGCGPALRIPPPHSALGRAPHSALLLRTEAKSHRAIPCKGRYLESRMNLSPHSGFSGSGGGAATGTLQEPELAAAGEGITGLALWAVVFAGGIGSRFW